MSTGRDSTELVELLRALGNLTINVNVTNAPGTSTSSGVSSRPEAAPAASSAACDPAPPSRPTVFGPWEPQATPAYFTARPRARKGCYVVLCGRNVDEPFYTTSAYLYSATVQTEPGRNFDPTSISHGFQQGPALHLRGRAAQLCLGAAGVWRHLWPAATKKSSDPLRIQVLKDQNLPGDWLRPGGRAARLP